MKEFQPLHPVRQPHWSSNSNASIETQAAWGINKRSWRYAHTHSMDVTLFASRRHGGMAPKTQMLEWKDTGSLGRTGRDDKVIEKPARRGATLDFVLSNKEGLVENVKLKVSLGCSDHEMVEFEILMAVRRMCSKLTSLYFRGADFGLFEDLLGKVYGRKPRRQGGPKKIG
ncbi:hypothetical protein BTVI_22172 [Pitangus sulphuratus]|nr:hypothetical protein BTVI_22172 [Pitangus sulphuratus]